MNILAALALAQKIFATGSKLIDAVKKAREEGRDDLSDEELQPFKQADDAARAELQSEIDSRKGS